MMLIASTAAAVGVAPGAGYLCSFVPSQICEGLSEEALIAWPSVSIGPSNSVSLLPSIRTFTVVGAACAAAAPHSTSNSKVKNETAGVLTVVAPSVVPTAKPARRA